LSIDGLNQKLNTINDTIGQLNEKVPKEQENIKKLTKQLETKIEDYEK
jgi:flagellar biosynthesis chaperone FliJ